MKKKEKKRNHEDREGRRPRCFWISTGEGHDGDAGHQEGSRVGAKQLADSFL